MTAEEVIVLADRKARASGDHWRERSDGSLRTVADRCPLESAAGTRGQDIEEALRMLGLRSDEHQKALSTVIGAADNASERVSRLNPHVTREEIDKARALMLATFDFGPEGDRA